MSEDEGAIEAPEPGTGRPFTVAIVGRPNVGKSTLFNRLVGKRLALVDDRPGVTRDRREGEAHLGDLTFTVIDTAGLEEAEAGSLAERMRQGTELAIAGADLVLFVVDARAGLTPADGAFAEVARRSGKPVVLVANKAEGRAGDAGALDAYALGLGDPIALSAEHGEGLVDLYDALRAGADAVGELPEDQGEKPLRFAVVGRPNAGKSTLINRLLGEERQLVGPEAGITRDSIGLDLRWRGRAYRVFDTAGLRRRANVQEKLEKLAVADALRAVQFAEVVVVLLDAEVPFEKQDLSIVDLVETEGRAIVVALNKWDLVEDPNALALAKERFERLLPQVKGAPLVPVSASTGRGLDRLMSAVVEAAEVWDRRVSTGRLNRWLEAALADHSPPAVAGRRIKIRYLTQVKARPPHFALFGNQLDALPEGYRRYLMNGLRKAFDLPGTPIRLSTRGGENPFEGKKEAAPRRPVRAQDRKRPVVPKGAGAIRPPAATEAAAVRPETSAETGPAASKPGKAKVGKAKVGKAKPAAAKVTGRPKRPAKPQSGGRKSRTRPAGKS